MRFLKDEKKRLRLVLLGGFSINLVYVLFNLLPAIIYGSIWAAVSTAYYLTVAVLRLALFARGGKKRPDGRRLLYRLGVLMLFLDVAVIGMIAYTAVKGRVIPYSGVFAVGYATFTLYSLASSLTGLLRYHSHDSPVIYAARNLALTVALTSTFSLQYSVLTALSAPVSVVRAASILTATVISVTVPTLSTMMILAGKAYQHKG